MNPRFAVVMPVGPGRMDNVKQVLDCIGHQGVLPEGVVLVFDGERVSEEWQIVADIPDDYPIPVTTMTTPKHQPGMEQPRNVGVRGVEKFFPKAEFVWFMDSDVIVESDCLEQFILAEAAAHTPKTRRPIIVGPYDWLPPGIRQPVHQLRNDPRWPTFDERRVAAYVRDLSAGLACFSGNLIWPIEEFKRVGGFWKEIHHGRCEDGELGLRAVAMGVPIVFAPLARGWHMDHPRSLEWIEAANARDVPMLNARHPWVQGAGLFVVEEDGKRFNCRCSCGWEGNTALIWAHEAECPEGVGRYVPHLA